MSGELAHTQLVRKLTASWLIMLLCCIAPLIGMNQTHGVCVGASYIVTPGVQGEWRGGTAVGGRAKGQCCAVLIICGMPPGMLFCISCECVCFVNFRTRFAVGFGADMIGEASIICGRAGISFGGSVGTLCSTLCSKMRVTLCSGRQVHGTLCRSDAGRSHSWTGLVRILLGSWRWFNDNFSQQEWVCVFVFWVTFLSMLSQVCL